MPATYRSYAGTGTVTFRDGYATPAAPFSIECKTNGRIEIAITIQSLPAALDVSSRMMQSARLQGQVAIPPARITISSITLYNMEVSTGRPSQFHFMAVKELRIISQSVPKAGIVTLKFGLVNLLLPYSMHPRILNDILTFDPLGNYWTFRQKLSAGEPQVTAEVTISTSPSHITSYEHAMRDVALLISFAMGTYVSVAYMDVLLNSTVVSTVIYHPKFLDYSDSVPVIDMKSGSRQLHLFLTGSFQHYQALKSKLRLDLALEYCVLAKSVSYLDVKFVTTFIALESLLTRLQNQLPKQKPRYGRLMLAKVERALFFFRRGKHRSVVLVRLQSSLQHYGLSDPRGVSIESPPDGTPNYARIRNWLVHGGTFPKNIDPLRVTYSLLDTYQRLLLAILNHRGVYVDCSVQPFVDRLVS
jgi:hypothetical protein